MNFYEILKEIQMSVIVSQVEVFKIVKKVAGWIANPEQWIKNETTKRMIKINGATHKKMLGEVSDKPKKVPAWTINPEQWVKNETTKRMVKIGSDTHKKMLGEITEKKTIDRSGMILNPTGTKRWIKIDGKLFRKFKAEGLFQPEMLIPLPELSEEETVYLLQ